MQPVTVALSTAGITTLLTSLIGNKVAEVLQAKLAPRDYSVPIGNFQYLTCNAQFEHDLSGISVVLSGGRFDSFVPTFTGFVQGPADASQFTITMTVNNLKVGYTWTEAYTDTVYTFTRGGGKPRYSGPTPGGGTYPFDLTLGTLVIHATFQLEVSNGAYGLRYCSSKVEPKNPQPVIPGGSILNQQGQNDCGYGQHISDATVQAIDSIDYGACVATALTPFFASVSQSGDLGKVKFDFLQPGPAGLAFPTGGGIQLGATGSVTANGTPFPGAVPPDLPLPPVPTGNPPPDATYYVQDYELNALCWGFYEAGVLQTTLTSGDISDSGALETNTYSGTTLNTLYMTYPACLMTAGITALAAPQIAFQTAFILSANALSQIEAKVGATAWGTIGPTLTSIGPAVFLDQTFFEANLRNSNPATAEYFGIIESFAAQPVPKATLGVRCVLNVLTGGQTVPVITFDVAMGFVLQDMVLGTSHAGKTQCVIFAFKEPMGAMPKATFVSSTLSGVDQGDFTSVWDALKVSWDNTMNAIGQAGMPLPRIPGFEFILDKATVQVVLPGGSSNGYLAITTNLDYVPESLAPGVLDMPRQAMGHG